MVRARAEPSRALIIMSYVVMATSNLLGSLSTCAQFAHTSTVEALDWQRR